MNNRIIYITVFDLHRLEELLEVAGAFTYRGRSDLKDLEEEVSRAHVVDSLKVPPHSHYNEFTRQIAGS